MNHEMAKEIPQEWKTYGKMFKALGDEERQRLMLAFNPGEELNATQLSEVSLLSRPCVSHHLSILVESGCLLRRKMGREVLYSINSEALTDCFGNVLDYAKNFLTKGE